MRHTSRDARRPQAEGTFRTFNEELAALSTDRAADSLNRCSCLTARYGDIVEALVKHWAVEVVETERLDRGWSALAEVHVLGPHADHPIATVLVLDAAGWWGGAGDGVPPGVQDEVCFDVEVSGAHVLSELLVKVLT
jgi:hypothetical protein